jgi:glutathione S-transferase
VVDERRAQIWRGVRFSDDVSHHDAIRTRGKQALAEQFAEIEERLSEGPFALGIHYSVVDPNLLAFYGWGDRVGFSMREQYPAWTRQTERPAVQQTIAAEGITVFAKLGPSVAAPTR